MPNYMARIIILEFDQIFLVFGKGKICAFA